MEIIESQWEFVALANGKTRIRTHLKISDRWAVGVPSFVIKYVQDHSLKDSVYQLMKAVKRLGRPPHPTFLLWKRSREQARLITSAQPSHAEPVDSWRDALTLLSFFAAVLLVCVLVAVLVSASKWLSWRRKTTRAVRQLGRELSRQSQLPRAASSTGSVLTAPLPRSCSLQLLSAHAHHEAASGLEAILLSNCSTRTLEKRSQSAGMLSGRWRT